MSDAILAALSRSGHAITGPLLDQARLDEVLGVIADFGEAGSRTLLERPLVRALAAELRRHPALAAILQDLRCVQCTLFAKTATRNWLVPLHQDLSIPVAERVPAPEVTGWSLKDDCLFAQPPDAVLEALVAVRLQLDPASPGDGALWVVAGSHGAGRLTVEQALTLRRLHGEVPCPVPCGGALVLRPLLLHRSSRQTGEGPRRVLHFLYGPAALPFGLRWAVAV